MTALDLLDDERILWTGAPAAGMRLQGRDAFLSPLSLMWFGFAIFWEFRVNTLSHAPMFFRLWGIPFVLVGLFAVFGRFFLDAWLRARTRYVVINHRILIWRAVPDAA